MRATWYVLEDGSTVDPNEVAPDKAGVLRHKNGAVAMRGQTPSSRGVDLDDDGKLIGGADVPPKPSDAAGKRGKKPKPEAGATQTADMQPDEPQGGYVTRESAAD